MHRGYIALYRRIQDNFLWKQRRVFSKAEAWIDILMEAQHSIEPKEVMLGMKVLTCHYGQCLKSIKTWAKRWRWSQNKVRRFFELLEKCSMIVTKNEHVTTRITVTNYSTYNSRYNSDGTANGTTSERLRNANGTDAERHRQTDNNDNNVNNEKNVNGKTFSSSAVRHPLAENKLKTFEQMQVERAEKAMAIAGKEFLADDKG